jgi:hypothetical protein
VATIPSGIPEGTGYRIRVTDYFSGTIGTDNGTDIKINTCLVSSLINSISTGLVSLYPNPTTGTFFIHPSETGDANLLVMNSCGEVIYQNYVDSKKGEPMEVKLDTTLKPGIYMVKLEVSGKIYSSKLTIF